MEFMVVDAKMKPQPLLMSLRFAGDSAGLTQLFNVFDLMLLCFMWFLIFLSRPFTNCASENVSMTKHLMGGNLYWK